MDLDKESLSIINKNIINWYPWKENSKILEINANSGELTEELSCHADKVVAIEENKEKYKELQEKCRDLQNTELISDKLENVELNEKFDYILINSIKQEKQTLEKILDYANKYINESGILLILLDNKFGLATFNCKWEDNEDKDPKIKMEKTSIEQMLKKQGFENYKFYYPLPNYKTPNVIYTDNYMPNEESILRDLTLYNENTVVITDERNKYKEIINENINLFSMYANSFLIETSKMPITNEIKYVSFGNSRKEKYRMKTIMNNEQVYKEPVLEEGKEHLQTIKNNIIILNRLGINILDTFDENKIYSKLIKNVQSFDKMLIEMAKENGTESILESVQKFYKDLENKLEKSEQTANTVFEKYNIEINEEAKRKLHFIKDGIYDLIFQNAFLIDNEFHFYDQEWIEENIPIEFIMYRAIYYLGNSCSAIDTDELYKRMNIYPYKDIFEKLENILQYQIKDEKIWKIHAESFKTIRSIHDTCIHYNNLRGIAENEALQLKEQLKNNELEKERLRQALEEKNHQIKDLEFQLNYVISSKSWKMTEPLRNIRRKFNKKLY